MLTKLPVVYDLPTKVTFCASRSTNITQFLPFGMGGTKKCYHLINVRSHVRDGEIKVLLKFQEAQHQKACLHAAEE